jgi:putative beta-lysine N-acetyltransferase
MKSYDELKSTLSHGNGSKRVYLMDLHPDDFPAIIDILDQMASEYNYSKLFAKVPAKYGPSFINAGYIIEASVPGFYNNCEDALFIVKYTTPERHQPETPEMRAFQELILKPIGTLKMEPVKDYKLRPLTESDAKAMVTVFKKVFATYPFPIFEPDFLIKSMKTDDTRYFGAFYDNELIGISSAECNVGKQNAEMTDFAVLPLHRGKRLANHLLSLMENSLAADGFKTLYTIARLHSLPMNKTFYNQGYRYSGTLIRNTQISGKIESMNVWYKKI